MCFLCVVVAICRLIGLWILLAVLQLYNKLCDILKRSLCAAGSVSLNLTSQKLYKSSLFGAKSPMNPVGFSSLFLATFIKEDNLLKALFSQPSDPSNLAQNNLQVLALFAEFSGPFFSPLQREAIHQISCQKQPAACSAGSSRLTVFTTLCSFI